MSCCGIVGAIINRPKNIAKFILHHIFFFMLCDVEDTALSPMGAGWSVHERERLR